MDVIAAFTHESDAMTMTLENDVVRAKNDVLTTNARKRCHKS